MYPDLIKQLNPNVPLLLAAKHIPWEIREEKFAQEKDIVIDTTVQEKNITFLTDIKLYVKIICKCCTIAIK